MASRPCMRHDHYGIGSCPQCEDEQAIADLERELLTAYQYIHRNTPLVIDHACAKCVPGGDIVIEGFVCVQHRACDYIDRKEGGDDD